MTSNDSNTAGTLRAELKDWERSFAAANDGRKADRSDIKKDPTIGMIASILFSKIPTADIY